jgi:hypothetical protein
VTSFSPKLLRFTFVLSNNAMFEGTNSNRLTVEGLRATANVRCAGAPAFPEVTCQIFGMKQDDMNALTSPAFDLFGTTRNVLQVEANSGSGWATIFAGQITEALPDYADMPNVSLRVRAQVLQYELIDPVPVTNYTGPTDVATIVQTIATKMQRAFENNGVSAQLDSPYLPNTLADQLRTVCEQAGVQLWADPASTVIAISPKGVPRNVPVWVLSPATGLVGYPVIDSNGYIGVRSIFNPAFRFGGPVRVEGSDVPRANGDWVVNTLNHMLESNKPGGAWFSEMLLYPRGGLQPVLS